MNEQFLLCTLEKSLPKQVKHLRSEEDGEKEAMETVVQKEMGAEALLGTKMMKLRTHTHQRTHFFHSFIAIDDTLLSPDAAAGAFVHGLEDEFSGVRAATIGTA